MTRLTERVVFALLMLVSATVITYSLYDWCATPTCRYVRVAIPGHDQPFTQQAEGLALVAICE